MKTTVDLPDPILERAKIAAAKRRTTLKKLIIEGLETVLHQDVSINPPSGALDRLQKGYHLGGKPLNRDEIAEFVSENVEAGRYGSANEVIRAGLRLLQDQETKMAALRSALIEGENSGKAVSFDINRFINEQKNRAHG